MAWDGRGSRAQPAWGMGVGGGLVSACKAQAVGRKGGGQRAKCTICFLGTLLAPGLSLPPPNRAPVGAWPPMVGCQGYGNRRTFGDQVLGLGDAASSPAGAQEHCRPSTAPWARLCDLPLHLVCQGTDESCRGHLFPGHQGTWSQNWGGQGGAGGEIR